MPIIKKIIRKEEIAVTDEKIRSNGFFLCAVAIYTTP